MKKLILFALVALTLPVSAASINWQLNTLASANYMVGEDGNKLTGTAYLMLTDSLAGVTFTSEQDIIDLAVGGSEGAVSIVDGVNKNVNTATDSRLVAPTEYSFTVLLFDKTNNSFYTSEARSNATYNLGADLDNYGTATEIKFTAAQVFATAAKRGTQTWTAVGVPEPSSAMLGLLGLGLLLKRRKA